MIIIFTPSLVPHDAVGNDVRRQHKIFKEAGLDAFIFCENYQNDGYSLDYLLDKEEVFKFIEDKNTVLIYHHSIYWHLGEEILRKAKCRIIIKYHNITPPEFFAPYNKHIAEICRLGREQTKYIVGLGQSKDIVFTADSEFNARELKDLGVNSVKVIAPFHKLDDFNRVKLNLKLAENIFSQNNLNVLFVGRFVPNKGHKHLVEVIRRYIHFYDNKINLHIVGAITNDLKKYFDEVKFYIKSYNLEDNIKIYNKISFVDLYTLYKVSDIFLLLSEHEGFCVPIIEAQYNSLPVIAHDRAAIGETLGENQLIFKDTNYTKLAVALNVIKRNSDYKLYLAQEGKKNLKKFSIENLNKKTLELIGEL